LPYGKRFKTERERLKSLEQMSVFSRSNQIPVGPHA